MSPTILIGSSESISLQTKKGELRAYVRAQDCERVAFVRLINRCEPVTSRPRVLPRFALTRFATNHALATRMETSNAWIIERTGIEERRRVIDGETGTTLATAASCTQHRDRCRVASNANP